MRIALPSRFAIVALISIAILPLVIGAGCVPNVPPIADAGDDQTVSPGATVTLKGSGFDVNGDPLSFEWQQIGGESVTLDNADTDQASFTAPDEGGTLAFRLIVTDGRGGSGADSVEVTVIALEAGPPGVALLDAATLAVALPITNHGTTDVQNVQVTAMTLANATLTSPSLPLALGTIPADSTIALNATFTGSFTPLSSLVLSVEGTFDEDGESHSFTLNADVQIPSMGPGSGTFTTAQAGPAKTSGGPFPAPPPEMEEEEENPAGHPIPIGPESHIFADTITASPTSPGAAPGVNDPATSVAFTRNTTNPGAGFPPDPSVASSGNVVMASYNTAVMVSTDGGANFTTYNPGTLYSDNPDGGLCCDQVIHYAPSIDRFIWLIQTRRAKLATDTAKTGNTGPNRLRIAYARPVDVGNSFYGAWSYFDLTSATFGFGNEWIDYPDLSVGDNFLYVSADRVGTSTTSGFFVSRIPLTQIRDRVNVDIQSTKTTDGNVAYGGHLSQNTGNEVFWAGHNTTSQMRIFRWPENGGYSWTDTNVNTWSNTDYTSKGPDGQYWLPAPLGFGGAAVGIIGATRHSVFSFVPPGVTPPPNEVWFAWTAGRNAPSRPHPYIEIARFSDVDLHLVGQFQIFNANHAYAVPALHSDLEIGTSSVAISCAWGGGSFYANNAVGVMFFPSTATFPINFGLASTSNSDVTLTASPPGTGCADVSGGATPNRCSRYGDYFSVRRVGTSSCKFCTLGYATRLVNPAMSTDCTVAPGCTTVVNYVEFGDDECLFPAPGPR